DWSSDVCSSDLLDDRLGPLGDRLGRLGDSARRLVVRLLRRFRRLGGLRLRRRCGFPFPGPLLPNPLPPRPAAVRAWRAGRASSSTPMAFVGLAGTSRIVTVPPAASILAVADFVK